jgi:small subunit ribosomal protein S16
VAVRIRLLRMGKIRNPQYRIVVADARTKRDGRAIEQVGIYHPKEDPSFIQVRSDRIQYWLGVGAQPSEAVRAILSKTGDWQKFKGLPAPEPLKVAPARADRTAVYEAEAKAAAGVTDAEATKAAAKRAEPRKVAKAQPTAAGPETPAEPAAPAAAAPAEPVAAAPAEPVAAAPEVPVEPAAVAAPEAPVDSAAVAPAVEPTATEEEPGGAGA